MTTPKRCFVIKRVLDMPDILMRVFLTTSPDLSKETTQRLNFLLKTLRLNGVSSVKVKKLPDTIDGLLLLENSQSIFMRLEVVGIFCQQIIQLGQKDIFPIFLQTKN